MVLPDKTKTTFVKKQSRVKCPFLMTCVPITLFIGYTVMTVLTFVKYDVCRLWRLSIMTFVVLWHFFFNYDIDGNVSLLHYSMTLFGNYDICWLWRISVIILSVKKFASYDVCRLWHLWHLSPIMMLVSYDVCRLWRLSIIMFVT